MPQAPSTDAARVSIWFWISSGVGAAVAIAGTLMAVLAWLAGRDLVAVAPGFAFPATMAVLVGVGLAVAGIACAVLPWFFTTKPAPTR